MPSANAKFKNVSIKKKEVKGQEYYLWNYEPNQNQNATSFMNKLIGKLYRNNECLVVEVNNHIYVADSYSKEVLALKEYRFSGITFDGYELSETREMSEVMFFRIKLRKYEESHKWDV